MDLFLLAVLLHCRTDTSPEGLFFHATELMLPKEGPTELVPLSFDDGVRIDLTQHVSVGDRVFFLVAAGQRNSRFTAKQVGPV